jgi:hypothetical protein
MQTKPEQITPTFAPETQFNVKLSAHAVLSEPIVQSELARSRFIAAQEKPDWRGVRFSALND